MLPNKEKTSDSKNVNEHFTKEELLELANSKRKVIPSESPEGGALSTLNYNPDIAKNLTTGYSSKEKEEYDTYYEAVDKYNASVRERNKQNDIRKINEPDTWYSAFTETASRSYFDKYMPLSYGVAGIRTIGKLTGIDNTWVGGMGKGVLDFSEHVQDMGLNFVSHLFSDISQFIADNIEGRDVGRQMYDIDKRIAANESLSDEKRAIAKSDYETRERIGVLETSTAHTDFWKSISEYLDMSTRARNARNPIETDFEWSNDWTDYLSGDFGMYMLRTTKELIPQLGVSLAEGFGAGAAIRGGGRLASSVLKKGVKTSKKDFFTSIQETLSKITGLKIAKTKIAESSKVGKALIARSEAMLKGNFISQMGISAALTGAEGGFIGRDVEREALMIGAERYGGENWEAYLEEVKQKVSQEGTIQGLNEEQIMLNMEIAGREAVHKYFSEKDPDAYRKILETTRGAVQISRWDNNAMIVTNAFDAAMITAGARYRGMVRNSIKALKGKSLTRALKVRKPSGWRTLGLIGAGVVTEGLLEEGGINKYAEWHGIAFAEGREFTHDEFIKRTLEGESWDEMFAGGLMGLFMVGGTSSLHYKSKKEAYQNWKKAFALFKKGLPQELEKQLANMIKAKGSAMEAAKINRAIETAKATGQDTDMLYAMQIVNQAVLAFQTGNTESLLKMYDDIAKNNEDAEMREYATEIRNEILELEKDYNEVQEFGGSERIFGNIQSQKITEKQINNLDELVSLLRVSAMTELDKLSKKFPEADYTFNNNGSIRYTGTGATNFKAEALKNAAVGEYNQRLNDKSVLELELEGLQKEYDSVTSERYQKDIEQAGKFYEEINRNAEDIIFAETKREFHENVGKILEKYDLSRSAKKEVKEVVEKKFDAVVLQQRKEQETQDTTGEKKRNIRNRKTRKIARKLNNVITQLKTKKGKEDKNHDDLPIDIEDMADEYGEEMSNTVRDYVNENTKNGEKPTFSQMIESLIGLNQELTEEEIRSNAGIVEEQFNMLVLGWKRNNYASTNFDAVYKKYFGEKETAEQRLRKKLAGTLKKAGKKGLSTEEYIEQVMGEERVELEEEKNPTVSETTQEIEKQEKKEKKSIKQRTSTVRLSIKLNFKIFATTQFKGNWITRRITNSNIQADRLANPNKFNKGDKLGLRVNPGEKYAGVIIAREKDGTYTKLSRAGMGKGTNTESMYIEEKYSRAKASWVGKKRTFVKNPSSGVFTFVEFTHQAGETEEVSHKTYDQRPTGKNALRTQHFITDDMMVTNDGDHTLLEEAEIIHLRKMTLRPSAEGKSEIEVDIVDKNGVVTPHTIEIENEIEQNTPIMVVDPADGTPVAWIQTPAQVLIDTAEVDQAPDRISARLQQKKLVEYRKGIAQGKVVQATIGDKTGFTYSKLESETVLDEQDPDSQIGYSYGAEIYIVGEKFENDKRVIVNKEDITGAPGMAYELRRDGTNSKGQETYLVLRFSNFNSPLDNTATDNIFWAMASFIGQADEKSLLKDTITKDKSTTIASTIKGFGYNILSGGGLSNYLRQFAVTSIPSKYESTDPKAQKITNTNFMKFVNSAAVAVGEPVLVIDNKRVLFAIKQEVGTEQTMTELWVTKEGLSSESGVAKAKTVLEGIKTSGSKFKRSHHSKAYTDDKKMAEFDGDGNITATSYKEYQRKSLKTDVKAWELEDGEGKFKTTVTNASITLETDVEGEGIALANLSNNYPSKKSTTEAVEDNKMPDRTKLLAEAKSALRMLGSAKTDSIFSLFEDELDSSDMLLNDEERDELRKSMEIIPDVTASQVDDLVNNVFNHVLNKYDKVTSEIINEEVDEAFSIIESEYKKDFLDLIAKLKELRDSGYTDLDALILEFENKMEMFDTILEHIATIKMRTAVKLNKYINLKTNDFDDVDNEADTTREKIYSESNIEFKGKENIPTKLKKFMAGIQNIDKKGNIIRGFLGVPTYVPFDFVFDTVTEIIGSTPKANMTFEEMIETLESFDDAYPFLRDLILKLKNPNVMPPHFQSMFMKNMVKHRVSMKYVQYKYNYTERKYELRVLDTNSAGLERIIRKEWENQLAVNDDLVIKNNEGQLIVDKDEAKKLYKEFEEIKDAVYKGNIKYEELAPKLKNWLANFGITISDQTVQELINGEMVDVKGDKLPLKGMFDDSKKSAGLFGGIAYNLYKHKESSERVNITDTPELHYYYQVTNAIVALSRIESKYNARTATIAFRDGDKSIGGFTATKFATDRVEDMKVKDSHITTLLKDDAYSSGSMLLDILTSSGYGNQVRHLLYADHLGINALKKYRDPPSGDENGITKMSEGNQEVTKHGFFADMRQGRLRGRGYKGFKLRMARMLFPTMSDKDQMLAMYMPVLDLDGTAIEFSDGQLVLNNELDNILFSQLVLPELRRIIKHNKMGAYTGIQNYDIAAQYFMMIPQLNQMTIGNKKLIQVLAESPKLYTEEEIITEIRKQAKDIIRGVIQKEAETKVKRWGDEGIITAINTKDGMVYDKGTLNDEYFTVKDEDTNTDVPRFENNIVKSSAVDYIINNFIATSNMFQTVAGDIAFYSSDKLYGDFGIGKSREFINNVPELENVHSYNNILKELDKLLKANTISKEKYDYIRENIKPAAYDSVSDVSVEEYVNLTKAIGNNLGKRLALLLAPGDKVYGLKDTQYIQLFLHDSYEVADNIEHLIKLNYGEEGVVKFKEINKIKDPDIKAQEIEDNFPIVLDFFDINATDAQEYTTAKEHLDILFSEGKITQENREMLLGKIKDQKENGYNDENELTDKELELVFQPAKPVYTGSIYDKDINGMRMMYIKSSSYPLIPQLTANNELDALRIALEKIQDEKGLNVRAAYESAVKVGVPEKRVNIDNISELTSEQIDAASVTLDRYNFRIQQDIPVHAMEDTKDEVLMGTQLMKLLFGDGVTEIDDFSLMGKSITGRKLLDVYNDTYGELVKHVKDELFTELGLSENGEPVDKELFLRNLSDMLKKEALARNYPQQDIDGLTIDVEYDNDSGIPTKVAFKNSIWISSNSMRYEALLNSLVTKKMIKLKLPGYSYIAGSQKGFDIANNIEDTDVNPSRIIYTTHFDFEKGSLRASTDLKKAQIFIPSRFRNNKGELIDLFEGEGNDRKYIHRDSDKDSWKLKDGMIAESLLDITSFRIPTSSHVSASQVEIAGFLPPENGDLMIVPKEFAVQKGLDYDIDKEFSYHLWHSVKESGQVVAMESGINLERIEKELKITREEFEKAKKTDVNAKRKLEYLATISQEEIDKMDYEFEQELLENKLSTELDVVKLSRKLKYLGDTKKKLLQNRIVRINSAVLSSTNASLQKKITKALSMAFAGGQSKLLQDDNIEFNSLLSDEYQTMKMNMGAAGQMGIGVYSNYVVFNSQLQQTEKQVRIKDAEGNNVSIRIGNYVSSGVLGRYTNILSTSDTNILKKALIESDFTKVKKNKLKKKIETGRISHEEIQEILKGTKNENILLQIRGIAEAFAERQNTATDNAKEEIMGRVGVNSGTINVDSFLTLLGFDKGNTITDIEGNKSEASISYLLISQPIIKEYIKRKERRNSVTNDEFESTEEIIESLLNKYGVVDVSRSELTTQTLYDNIKKETQNTIQTTVLQLFVELETYGRDLTAVQQTINVTKDGLGKSILNTIALYENVESLGSNATFENISELVGDYIDSSKMTPAEKSEKVKLGYVEFDNVMILPKTMMGHILVNGSNVGYKLWTPFFPYNSLGVRQTMNKIVEMGRKQNYTENDMIELKKMAMHNIKKFFNSTPGIGVVHGMPFEERKRLFTDSPDNPSLSKYMNGLKLNNNSIIIGSKFLGRMLNYDSGEGKDVSLITFNNTNNQSFDEEDIYSELSDMVTNPQALPDNPSYSEGDLKYMDEPFSMTDESNNAIASFNKTVLATKKHKTVNGEKMKIGDIALVIINGQRFKIIYQGEMTKKQYGDTFEFDNGVPIKEGTNADAFNKGETRNVYKIAPMYTTAHLAEDLISYSFLSGGVFGAIDFVKYIPLKYLELVGFTKAMNEIDFDTPGTFLKLLGGYENELGNFIIQFFQHNPKLLASRKMNDVSQQNNGLATLNDIYYENITPNEDKTYPPMFTIYSKENYNYHIFMLVNDTYIRIPEAGTHGMSEYDVTKANINSLVSEFEASSIRNTEPGVTKSTTAKSSNWDEYDVSSKSSKDILTNIAERDDKFGRLASVLIPLNDSGVKIEVVETTEFKGRYTGGNTHRIQINKRYLTQNNTDEQAMIFLHEYLHAITSNHLNDYFDNDGNRINPNEKLPEHIEQLVKVYDIAKKELGITNVMIEEVKQARKNKDALTPEQKITYSFINLKEFVTMSMTSTELQTKLQKIKVKDKSLLEEFADFVNKVIQFLNPDAKLDLLSATEGVILNLVESAQQGTVETFVDQTTEAKEIINEKAVSLSEEKPALLAITQTGDNKTIVFIIPEYPMSRFKLVQEGNKYVLYEKDTFDNDFTETPIEKIAKGKTIDEFINENFGSQIADRVSKPVKTEKESPVERRVLKSKVIVGGTEIDVNKILELLDEYKATYISDDKNTQKLDTITETLWEVSEEWDEEGFYIETGDETVVEAVERRLVEMEAIEYIDKNQLEIDFKTKDVSTESISTPVPERMRSRIESLKEGDILKVRISGNPNEYSNKHGIPYKYLSHFINENNIEHGSPSYDSVIDRNIYDIIMKQGKDVNVIVTKVLGLTFEYRIEIVEPKTETKRSEPEKPGAPIPYDIKDTEAPKGKFESETKEYVNIIGSKKKSPYFKKDVIKFSKVNKLISRGSSESSSNAYAIAAGNLANTGKYNAGDIVGISAEGARKNRIPPDTDEIKLAASANVQFVTDNLQDRERNYNVGEREVAGLLMSLGYSEYENSGIWTKDNIETETTVPDLELTPEKTTPEFVPDKTEYDISNEDIRGITDVDNMNQEIRYEEMITDLNDIFGDINTNDLKC